MNTVQKDLIGLGIVLMSAVVILIATSGGGGELLTAIGPVTKVAPVQKIQIDVTKPAPINGPTVTVLAPNGGEVFPLGSTNRTITWRYDRIPSGSTVGLVLWKGGVPRPDLYHATGFLSTNASWDVPYTAPLGVEYAMEVTIYASSGVVLASDRSDGNFTLTYPGSAPSIRVDYPNSWGAFRVGTEMRIDGYGQIPWGFVTGTTAVNFTLYKGGVPRPDLFQRSLPVSGPYQGSFSAQWMITPTTPLGEDYQMEAAIVSSVFGSSTTFASDRSDNNFWIVPNNWTQPYIGIIHPNGGERWPIGSTQRIAWSTQSYPSGSDISIELYKFPGPRPDLFRVDHLPVSGTYDWNIPTGTPLGSDYKMHFMLYSSGTIMTSSYSYNVFTITSPLETTTTVTSTIQ